MYSACFNRKSYNTLTQAVLLLEPPAAAAAAPPGTSGSDAKPMRFEFVHKTYFFHWINSSVEPSK